MQVIWRTHPPPILPRFLLPIDRSIVLGKAQSLRGKGLGNVYKESFLRYLPDAKQGPAARFLSSTALSRGRTMTITVGTGQ